MDGIYLDNAATTPLVPEVREAMLRMLDQEFGNPSSRHPLGVRAREAVDLARRRVARAVGVQPERVIFTSGGTEANNLAVLGLARASRKRKGTRHVLAGPTEHACVRAATLALGDEGCEVETLALDAGGGLDLQDLERRLRSDTALVSVMLANNEFGSVYPIREVARRVRRLAPAARLHVDAVQAFGKVDVVLDELGCDSLALSGHKLHGPKGTGALVLGEPMDEHDLDPLFRGGGQERGLRSGTENVAGIVGFGIAAELAVLHLEENAELCRAAREIVREKIAALPGARLLELGPVTLDAICALYVPGVPAEVRMHHLEERGVYVSAGSACHASKQDTSPALLAAGLDPDQARRVLRLSFARTLSLADVERAAQALVEVSRELQTTT